MLITSTSVKKRKVRARTLFAPHDTDQISITPSESKDTLTEATSDFDTVHSKSTVAKDSESEDKFILARETVVRFLQDSIAEAVDRQKRDADKNGRSNVILFNKGDLFLLSTVNLPRYIVSNVGSTKLLPMFIGPFCVLRRPGNAYTIELPRKMRTHPTLYVGRLRLYYRFGASSGEEIPCAQASPPDTCAQDAGSQLAYEV